MAASFESSVWTSVWTRLLPLFISVSLKKARKARREPEEAPALCRESLNLGRPGCAYFCGY